MAQLLPSVRRTIRRYGLCPPGSTVLVAISGGSDSVALTFLLRELAAPELFSLAGLAHLNHRMRASADRDEAFCRALAERLDLPIVIEACDVRAYADAQRLSPEDAARRVRYDFLHRAASRLGAGHIAVGHTQDDQAETFLFKLIRGAGLTGLAAIHPRRDAVIRPLIDIPRDLLREYLRSRGEPWVDDETNEDLRNPRNRIRHRVLPELDLAYGAPTRPAIARAASLVREDAQFLDDLSKAAFDDLAVATAAGLDLDAGTLSSAPLAIRRRVVRRALRQLAGDREVSADHVERALRVLSGSIAATDVPGSRVELRRGKLVLVKQEGRAK